jgi:hypothetical protein
MPRRYRLDEDDDGRPLRHRKKKSNTALIVGLSVGGGVLVLGTILTIIVFASNLGPRSDDPLAGALGLVRKPEGKRTSGHLQSVDDPAVVDRIWPRLVGKWEEINGEPGSTVYEFLPDYRYREEWTSGGKHRVQINPVTTIRDDASTTNARTDECYSIFYREGTPEHGRIGGIVVNVYPEGTLDINRHRYRRVQ